MFALTMGGLALASFLALFMWFANMFPSIATFVAILLVLVFVFRRE